MREDRPPKTRAAREDRIRELGFDPGHLTPLEQLELLEVYSWSPDEELAVATTPA